MTGVQTCALPISENLPGTSRRMKLLIPYSDTAFISRIRTDGKIFSEEYSENGIIIDALVDIKLISQAEKFLISD